MRRPLPLKTPYKVVHQVALRRRECAVFIGAIIAEWSALEVLMATIYATLTCGPELKGSRNVGHWVAIETFETIRGYRDKRRVLLAAAERRGFSRSTVDDLKSLLSRIQRAGENRVDTAHGRWVISDKYPDDLIFFKNAAKVQILELGKHPGGAFIYSVADFKEDLDEITELAKELQALFNTTLFRSLETMVDGRVVDVTSVENSKDNKT